MMWLVLVALIVGCQAKAGDEGSIKAVFDEMLAADHVTMSAARYARRLATFTVAYLSLGEDMVPNLDLMYSAKEDAKRNGAKMQRNIRPNEEIQKREELRMLETRAPPFYDARRSHPMNAAVHQMECGNCYLHVFVAALEIAYTKFSGDLLKFSEQEMTDCYYAGCGGGDYRMVTVLMTYLDKLSERANYGPYMDGVFTCRANTTPDSLSKIKAAQFVDVTTANVEEAVSSYGSVMTCMAWPEKVGEPCYMKDYQPGDVADLPEVEGGCDHAVLIVGYTPSYYIVRNSHGTTFGDDGYFMIVRNTNACGIEEDMAALVVAARDGDKPVGSNGCPLDKPTLCADIFTCVPDGEPCVEPDNKKVAVEQEVVEVEVVMEEEQEELEEEEKRDEKKKKHREIPGQRVLEVEERGELEKGWRMAAEKELLGAEKREEKRKKGAWTTPGEKEVLEAEKREEKRKKGAWTTPGEKEEEEEEGGRKERVMEKRAALMELEKRCADSSAACPNIAQYCHMTSVADMCPDTCGNCENAVEEEELPPDTDETVGNCYKPSIENGEVTNSGTLLDYGDVLEVTCDTGYVLVGEEVTCLIQDVYTNSDTDARLLPQCVPNTGETLTGNGENYSGTRAQADDGYNVIDCANWDLDVLKGYYMGHYDAAKYAVGNHNFCRNPGGDEPVPMCLSGEPAFGYYCFQYPGCDVCTGDEVDLTSSCSSQKCEYTTASSRNTIDWYWSNCKATCCAKAGC